VTAPEKLELVPFTPEIHAQVVELFKMREMNPPPMPLMAVAACGRAGTVVASMYLYETNLFLFNEFLCTNPAYPARLRHAAVLLMSQAVVAFALMKGLFVMTTPRTRGGELIAKRMGFKNAGIPMWVRRAEALDLGWTEPEEVPLRPDTEASGDDEVPDGDSWERMTKRCVDAEDVPEKRRASPAAKGRQRGKETEEAPARKTLQRVSRQGKGAGAT